MSKKLLFITWDSDASNYLETLFFPILKGLRERGKISPFVWQFSWAGKEEVARLSAMALREGISYTHMPISRRFHPILGTLTAVLKSSKSLKTFIEKNRIEIVMPRSTMPAWLVLRLLPSLSAAPQIIFDADGLPIQERVDFAGLKEGGLLHRLLTAIERKMLARADKVVVRSFRARDIHLQRVPDLQDSKFHKVGNGRSEELFYPELRRNEIRESLGIPRDQWLLVHSGSLSGGYETSKMFELIDSLNKLKISAKLLFLTRDEVTARQLIPPSLSSKVLVVTCPFQEIPEFLRAADIGICLRKKAKSIAGIAPIKLGEYLMCGLPVVLSEGIGDFDELMADLPFVFKVGKTFDVKELGKWVEGLNGLREGTVAEFGKKYFSLEATLDSYEGALNL